MPDLPTSLTFKAWQRSKLFNHAQPQGGRLDGKLKLTLGDTNTGKSVSPGDTHFTLMGAADIAGIKPEAIKHMAPAPFARDAETTKLVHIDLWEFDLPWRYTPRANQPTLSPWLVLLVGTVEEMKVEGGLVTHVEKSVLQDHNLAESYLWAHTQWDGHTTIARILSPRGSRRNEDGKAVGLLPQHEYWAVLVPAFNDAGEWMWTAAGDTNYGKRGVLPAFHFWRFWTAEPGDFETLAAALRVPPVGNVGKAKLYYRRAVPEDNLSINETLEVRGAITSLKQPETPQPEAIARVQSDLNTLQIEQENTIGLPHYGRPWLPKPEDVLQGWPHDLNDDPRFRGTAGLGVWMGVEGQEALMDAAVAQAGALREASQRISHLAIGLHAAGSLWDRRLPTNKNERLHLLGPILSRMVADDGGIVLDRVTSGSSPLPPALFSGAAQRILRDRTPSTRHISDGNGGLNRSAALNAANQPPRQPDRAPAGLPHLEAIAEQMGLPPVDRLFEIDDGWLDEMMAKLDAIVHSNVDNYQGKRDELMRVGRPDEIPQMRQQLAESFLSELKQTLQPLLVERRLPCESGTIAEEVEQAIRSSSTFGNSGITLLVFCQFVLADAGAQQQLHDELRRAVRHCMGLRPCERLIGGNFRGVTQLCNDLIDTAPGEEPPDQKPINLDRLSDALYNALDPRKPDAPARVRWCSRLVGVDCTRLIPPEFPIGLDFPTWSLLNRYDKEWLLPGTGDLKKNSITALKTNPTFIDAFMVGVNSQFMSEMRWRDLAVDRTCTPLRMFWGQVNYATQKREADIQPFSEWAKAPDDPLGALSHQSIKPHDDQNKDGSRLVIVFRSDLFRCYPSTLVYLVKPADGEDVDTLLQKPPQLDKPDAETAEPWRAKRQYFGPIFAGTLTPELVFFMFDVTPSTLEQYWLVLDEPPSELRFRNDKPINSANSATFAESTLDQPTRVAIDGKYLVEQGMQE